MNHEDATIFHIQKRVNDYVQIDKRPLEDPDLSYKAKGLLAYLLSRPPDWKVIMADLVVRSTDGKDAVQSALQELQTRGYAKLKTIQMDGQIQGKRWIIYELPYGEGLDEPKIRDQRRADFQFMRKPATTNNKGRIRMKENSDRCRVQGDRPSGLVPEDQLQDKFIIKSCHKLEDFVRSKHRLNTKRHNAERWYDEMRLLLQDIKGDRERLVRVMGTYIEEEHTNYTPIADSARSFRKKFISIERWANKVKPEDNRSQYREEVVG